MFSLATWVTLFQRAVMQGVPILFGATGEILTEKSGNLNLGVPRHHVSGRHRGPGGVPSSTSSTTRTPASWCVCC